MLEEGELKDNLDHTVSFRNCLVIMTSNAGARQITAESRLGFSTLGDGVLPYDEIKASATEELKRIMAPELINRIDDIIVFDALNHEQIGAILDIQLGELEDRLSEKNIVLQVRDAARNYLIDNGYDPSMGARPMRRLIQREIEDQMANLILAKPESYGAEKKTFILDCVNEKLVVKEKKSRTRKNELSLSECNHHD